MTNEQIAADIQRGEFLKNRIAQDTKELKAIESRLESAGLAGPHVDLEDKEREGKQRLLESSGRILPVRFESDTLIGSFAHNSTVHQNIKFFLDQMDDEPEGTRFDKLFKEVHSYERRQDDGKKFRRLAKEVIPSERVYHDIINLLKSRDKKTGIVKSKTVIAWDQLTPAPAK
jgi:hypothetical protein